MCARAATLVVALVLQAASLAPAPRRAVVYRGEEDIDVDAVAASLQSRGLEPDVVDVDRLAGALAQLDDVAAIYAGRYATHAALDALEATKPLSVWKSTSELGYVTFTPSCRRDHSRRWRKSSTPSSRRSRYLISTQAALPLREVRGRV